MVTSRRLRKGLGAAIAVFLMAAALVCAPRPAAADIVATGAGFSVVEEATRFVIELSGEPNHRMFVVDGPPRVVIDLDDVRFRLDSSGGAEASGLVSAWRYGALSGNEARVVLDLSAPALAVRQFFLPPLAGRPGRLILDFERTTESRFAAAARAATAFAPPDPVRETADGPVVVIDPGHGGVDPGASTKDGRYEKDIVLDFSRRLRDALEAAEPSLTVRLTRSDDRFLSLSQRIRIARAYGASLFVSIHADSAPETFVRGASVYTLSERPSDADAAALAARENLADTVSGVVEPEAQEEVSSILADLMRRETKTFSHAFAGELVDAMSGRIALNSNPHRYARFRVLMAHDIPSVLVELGYLTNADDTADILDPAWREKAIGAIVDAVGDFFAAEIASNTGGAGLAPTVPQPR
jgi:N-acetylmuramoyl-L-alanine amidase